MYLYTPHLHFSIFKFEQRNTRLLFSRSIARQTHKTYILHHRTPHHMKISYTSDSDLLTQFLACFFSSFSIILYYLLLLCDVLTYITIRIYIWKCKCRHAGQACIKCCSIEFLWVCRYVVICVYMMMRCRGKKTWKY